MAARAEAKASRDLWYPGNDSPAYLKGELPGDYGFDPLSLGSDPKLLKWFQQAELQHARWAMLGVVGILVPDIATVSGVADIPMWSEAGEAKYFADPLTLFVTELFVMGWAESRRLQDILNPGSVNTDPIFGEQNPSFTCTGKDVGYPGGTWFNPFGMANDEQVESLRAKEIKNGRLAMVSIVGFTAQTFFLGKGPVECWLEHLADPYHTTIFDNIGI